MKKIGCPVFGFIEVRAFFLKTRIPRDALEPLLTLQPRFEWQDSAAKRSPSLTAFVIRTKARQGQSDGESGEVCCEFASLSGTLLMVETRRYSRSFAYVARPRCRLFLRPRTPRPPSPSDRAAVRDKSLAKRVEVETCFVPPRHRVTNRAVSLVIGLHLRRRSHERLRRPKATRIMKF